MTRIETNDDTRLKQIYGFAAWCARQREKELWNAAGTCFYEHLADERATRDQIPKWVPADVFSDVLGLLADRMSKDEFADLLKKYDKLNRTQFSRSRP